MAAEREQRREQRCAETQRLPPHRAPVTVSAASQPHAQHSPLMAAPELSVGWKNSSTLQGPVCPVLIGSQCTEPGPASCPGRTRMLALSMVTAKVAMVHGRGLLTQRRWNDLAGSELFVFFDGWLGLDYCVVVHCEGIDR